MSEPLFSIFQISIILQLRLALLRGERLERGMENKIRSSNQPCDRT